jgi:hypothetical protein
MGNTLTLKCPTCGSENVAAQSARIEQGRSPITIAASGAAWKSDEAIGFVRIVPPSEGIKGLDVASAVVANDARDCKGKFASGRTSEIVDSDVVFRGFSSCDDTDGARLSQYFIVSRKKGGFVMFSVVPNMKTEEAKTVTREEKLVDFKKAAWSSSINSGREWWTVSRPESVPLKGDADRVR